MRHDADVAAAGDLVGQDGDWFVKADSEPRVPRPEGLDCARGVDPPDEKERADLPKAETHAV